MKCIEIDRIVSAVAELCVQANRSLDDATLQCIARASEGEKAFLPRTVMATMAKNFQIAEERDWPICQDTGMAVLFVEVGQEVHIVGGSLTDALNAGVRQGYREGYLRKSVVTDPLVRENSGDNTPAVIHYELVPGDALNIVLMPKGFGAENTSALRMLKPSDGVDGVKAFVLETIRNGAPNACAPIFVGIGLGGTMEKAALLSKKALLRSGKAWHPDPVYADLEKWLFREANALGIGPMGLGGETTVLGVAAEYYATHIAGLPVAVNICCYVNRHGSVTL